jgi:hypothetical protein
MVHGAVKTTPLQSVFIRGRICVGVESSTFRLWIVEFCGFPGLKSETWGNRHLWVGGIERGFAAWIDF